MHQNYWGEPTLSPRELLNQTYLVDAFRGGARRIFRRFGLTATESDELVRRVWELAAKSNDVDFELGLHAMVSSRFDPQLIRKLLDERASDISKQISPYLRGNTLLDVGAGDGMVAWNVHQRFQSCTLVDVMNYLDPRVQLPVTVYADGHRLSFADPCDSVLLINVLHHSDFPLTVLEDAWDHTNDRLIIIESVYGDPVRAGLADLPFCLSPRDQFLYTSFFDWFYNRVLHADVPVPCNFLSPPEWQTIFNGRGMRLANGLDLGIDVDIVPIHHFLFVLER